MYIGIGLILELAGHEPAMRFGKLDGFIDHAHSALSGGSYDDLRSKKPHQLTPLDAEWLSHRDHKRVSLGCANHGKPDPRISARRLYDRLTGLKLSGLLSCLDDSESQSILH